MADEFEYKISINDDEALAAFGRIAKKAEQTAKEAKDALGKIELGQQAREIEKAFALIQKSGTTSVRQLSKDELELKKAFELLGATGQFEFEKIRQEQVKTISTTDKLKGAFAKLTVAIGTLTGIAVAIKNLTDAAIESEKANFNLALSANAAAREFGTGVGTAESWRMTLAKIKEETKIYSEQDLANASARLVDMTKRLGLNEQQMQEVLKRTIDLAAGKVDLNGAIERTTSALRGEAESAEYLGLSLGETQVRAYAEAQGLVFKKLSDGEKAQLRYQLLLEQTNETQGRAAKYAETLAGKEDALNAKLSDQASVLGEELLPLREGYAELLTTLTDETEGSASVVSKFLASLAAYFVAFGAVATATTLNVIESFKAIGSIATSAYDAITSGNSVLDAIQGNIDTFTQSVKNSANAATSFSDAYDSAFQQILDGWQEQRDQAKKTSDELANVPVTIGGDTDTTLIDPEELQKALDKIKDLETDEFRARIDIIRKAGQKAVDTEQEFLQKRLDLATDFLRKIDDIERKNAQAIEDSGIDLRRDEEDAYKDYNRKLAELERDRTKKGIQIEQEYRDELRKIQQTFADNADEAARNRDAVTFLRLQRDRDRQIAEARLTRDKKVKEAQEEGKEKRDELKIALEQQLEDSRIADARRLEDLQLRLEREYEEARIANERDLQDTLLYEERKRQELKLSLDRQLQEADIANKRRVSDFKDSLEEEVKAQLEAELEKTRIVREQNAERASIYQQQIDQFKTTTPPNPPGPPGRQSGGLLGAGQSRIVGERGPEIFTPTVQGTVSPSITNFIRQPNITSSVINNINPTINQSMADQSAITRAIARNEAIATIQGILGNV